MALLDMPPELLELIVLNLDEVSLSALRNISAFIQTCRQLFYGHGHLLYRLDRDNHKSTALIWATQKGRNDILLRAKAAGVWIGDPGEYWRAVINGHLDTLKLMLLDAPDDLRLDDVRGGDYGDRSLPFLAARYGHVHMLQFLAEQGVSPALWQAAPVIHRAATRGHVDVVEFLLNNGTYASLRAGRDTPLFLAIERRQLGTAKVLLEHGADVNDADYHKSSLYSAARKDNLKALELLMEHWKLSIPTPDAAIIQQLLDTAVRSNSVRVAKFLLDNEARDVNSYGPLLYLAASEGFSDIVSLLVEYGVSVEARCNDETPILAACRNGHGSVVTILHKAGASATDVNRLGQTPLQITAESGHVYLLQN
jgi:ankyrin repeat protein